MSAPFGIYLSLSVNPISNIKLGEVHRKGFECFTSRQGRMYLTEKSINESSGLEYFWLCKYPGSQADM